MCSKISETLIKEEDHVVTHTRFYKAIVVSTLLGTGILDVKTGGIQDLIVNS